MGATLGVPSTATPQRLPERGPRHCLPHIPPCHLPVPSTISPCPPPPPHALPKFTSMSPLQMSRWKVAGIAQAQIPLHWPAVLGCAGDRLPGVAIMLSPPGTGDKLPLQPQNMWGAWGTPTAPSHWPGAGFGCLFQPTQAPSKGNGSRGPPSWVQPWSGQSQHPALSPSPGWAQGAGNIRGEEG